MQKQYVTFYGDIEKPDVRKPEKFTDVRPKHNKAPVKVTKVDFAVKSIIYQMLFFFK